MFLSESETKIVGLIIAVLLVGLLVMRWRGEQMK